MVAAPAPPPLEAARARAVGAFHEADIACSKYRVSHAAELFDELVPDRDVPGANILAALEQLRAALADYRGVENQGLAALAELGIRGTDLEVDGRAAALAAAIEDIDVDTIAPVFSRSLETPAGWSPTFVANDDQDGWVRRRS